VVSVSLAGKLLENLLVTEVNAVEGSDRNPGIIQLHRVEGLKMLHEIPEVRRFGVGSVNHG